MRLEIQNIAVDGSNEAVGIASTHPLYSWIPHCSGSLLAQTAYRITVTDENNKIIWCSGIVQSSRNFAIRHGGEPLKSDSDYSLEITLYFGDNPATAVKKIRTCFLNNDLPNALWIASEYYSPLVRKTFFLDKKLKYATAYISARGFYELYINGTKVGDRVLAPSPTPNGSIADAYDITSLLTPDNNTVGIWLAPAYKSRHFSKNGWCYSGCERAWCAVSLTFADGSREYVLSDDSWLTKDSPITKCGIYYGEVFDNRRLTDNWCSPYIDTSSWQNVTVINEKPPYVFPTVPVTEQNVKKCTRYEVRENETTFCDFGNNTVGYIRIKVIGEPGTKVIVTHSENITENGALNTFTNGDALCTDTFILNGNNIEIYKPRFTYHCFRYAEIRMDGVAQLISAEKVTIGSDNNTSSRFLCDDIMLQRMHDNAVATLNANMLHYYADCPVRDTRVPAPEAALTSEKLAFITKDLRLYYPQWLQRLSDGKQLNTNDPTVCGEYITAIWLLIENYGDTATAEANFKKAEQILTALEKEYKETEFAECRGDWCQPNSNPKNLPENCSSLSKFTGLCLFIHLLKTAEKIAKAINNTDKATAYFEKAELYTNELYEKYYKGGGRLYESFCNGEQTPNLAALALNIARQSDRKKIYAALKKRVRTADKMSIATGTFGTQFLISVLSLDDEGFEILQKLLHSTYYPSFGEQLMDYDATTLCEQWFGLQGQMCCCHPSFGGVFADFYTVFAGIENGGDAFRHIKINPHMPQSVNRLNCVLATIRGNIEVYLRRFGEEVSIDVIIPSGCDAEITLPNGKTVNVGYGEHTYGELLRAANDNL